MEKVQSREWDSGKPSAADWKARNQSTPTTPSKEPQDSDSSSLATSQWARGGSPGRGSSRGRGRGRGSTPRRGGAPTSPSKEVSEPSLTETTSESNTLDPWTKDDPPATSW